MAEVPRWTKISQQDYSWWVLHYILWLCQFYLSSWVIRKKICWTSFDMLIHASTTQKIICSFELSHFSCLPAFVYQLIVKSMCAFVNRCLLLLWSVKPFYFRMTRRDKLQNLIHIQDWVKVVVLRRSKYNQTFDLFYSEVLPYLRQDRHENCTISYESLMQWYFLPSLFISRFPCCCNRNADRWTMMCEINTASNSVAW